MKLTERAIKSFEPSANRQSFSDGRGLELRITPDFVMSWSLLYRFQGKKIRHTIGNYPAVKLKDARVIADKLRNQIAHGTNPQDTKRIAKKDHVTSVNDCYQQFLSRYLQLQLRTWPEYDRRMRADVLPLIGNKEITKLNKADILKIIDGIMDRGAPVLANRVLQYISKFLKWCVGRGYIENNPALNIPKPAKESSRERVLSLEEIRAIFMASDDLGAIQAAFIKVLILTGQRRSEISKLQWRELFDERIEIGGDRSKNGRPIITPLTGPVRAILSSLPRNNGTHVFSSDGGHSSIGNFSSIKQRLQKHSRTANWTYHDFRRTMATTLQESGVSKVDIGYALNHTDHSVTATYTKSDYETVKLNCLSLWSKLATDF